MIKHITLLILAVFLLSNTSYSENPVIAKKKKRPKIGLVLSGGGAKGFAYIGMLKVFNEVGLHVDYIGGTSIGSIIGGLYAIGYSPEAIEEMVRNQNWDALLRDEIPRKYIAYYEKDFMEQSIVSLPFNKKKVGLNKSMYKGQQINLLLNKYFSPAWNVNDFNDLPTPFLCVGTNLFNGDAEVLRSGYLPMAIRSSMSIPGYFSPTLYNGKYLVDGGLVDNYPAEPVIDMGADYLVGGDVQSGLKDTISELESIPQIINQIVFFHAQEANFIADSLIKINIKFKVPANMMDFNKYDTIIAYGQSIANEYRNELKQLADYLNSIEKVEVKTREAKPLKYIDIADVIYVGNKKMSKSFLDNYFGGFKNTSVTFEEIEEVVTSVFGTRFFERVFYRLEPAADGRANLIIDINEASPGYLSASIHYDGDYHGSARVNGIFRNIFGNRSKLFAELVLGTNPRLRALYLISNGAKPGFGAMVDMYEFKFNYYEGTKKLTQLSASDFKASVFVTSTLANLYNFSGGFEYQYFRFKQNVVVDSTFLDFEDYKSYGNFFVKFRADTRNKPYFSTSGYDAEFSTIYAFNLSEGWVDTLFTNSLMMSFKINHNIPISNRLTLRPGLFTGITFKQAEPPIQHWYGAGGLNEINYVNNFVPFTGIDFVQRLGLYAGIVRLKLQYNVYKKLYFTLRSDLGAVELSLKDMVDPANTLFGYGITTSYDSFIGPVEFSVMGSNINPNPSYFINVGFSF